ncbi:tRNA synthetases class I (M)-domain-containing protein [Calycina marina]|uniref:methionine--tRNA ligase n=1 Tax=Calycina marina TaxID=1763456 RepID=A0A9P7YY69_9HELO|nr:tRNA synthetases class I (M)-domain-containing protein [Calycina marina]
MTDKKIILPEKGKENILITSALPYVNNVPHLGNIIGSVLSADVFSRYSKLRGKPTLFICGTDEYGTATETKALETKQTPQELCDEFHAKHKAVYDWFDIDFDYFGRTTTDQQTVIAQDIFTKLWDNGFLEERTTKQPFCEHTDHNSFLADRFVEGICPKNDCGYNDARGDQCDKCGALLDPFELIAPHCKVDGTEPVQRDTTHVFLKLDKLQPEIEKWFNKSSVEGAWPFNGVSITDAWLKQGLEGRSITRDLKWGTPIPSFLQDKNDAYKKKVLYVWFDACIGYPSITANYTKDWEQWWRNPDDVKLYQFMGKDNVQFHTVIFPGSQIGTRDKWTQLNHLSTTEYLNYENGKFSKSRGIGVFGDSVQDTDISASVWRYYLLSNRPETGDTQFEWEAFKDGNNGELLANIGNFVNRIVKFVNAKLDSTVPEFDRSYTDADLNIEEFIADVNKHLKEYNSLLEAVKLKSGLRKVLEISSLGNWLLQKRLDNANLENEPVRTKTVITLALNLVDLLASIASPYMPGASASIARQLNKGTVGGISDIWDVQRLKTGDKIGKAELLFTRIDPKDVEGFKEKYGGSQAEKKAEAEKKAKKAEDKAKSKARKAERKAAEAAKVSQTEMPTRGKVAEEQAPPPLAAL